MDKNSGPLWLRALRWCALVTGTLVLFFLLWMLLGHLFGDANGLEGMEFHSARDLVGFSFFPVLTIIGLLLAYKWELLGGLLALLSIAALMLIRPDLSRTAFWLWIIPGVLYVLHWWMKPSAGIREQGTA